MKKFLFLLLALVLSVSVSCSDDKTGDTGGSMLSVTPTEIEFEAAGGSRLLDLRTDAGAWSLTQSDNTAWCTPALTSGKTSTSFAVTATANESSKRSATLTFTAPGCDPVVVTVTQSGDASQDFEGEQVVAQPDAWDNRKRADISYQLLVYSFADGNGDKVGDLPGLTRRLDYIDALGASAVWLSPIHPAASYHGYDVLDYEAVNPAFGTDADLRAFIDAAHARGIRVYLDYVLNHTGKDHPWFKSAAASEGSPYRDRYIFSEDPQADIAAGRIDQIATEGAAGYDAGQWFSTDTGAGAAGRFKFVLDWTNADSPTVTVTETTDAADADNTQGGPDDKYLYFGNGTSKRFYARGGNSYELTLDFDSDWGFLVRTSTTSWAAGTKYGAPDNRTIIRFGEPFTLMSNRSADPANVQFSLPTMYHSHFWTAAFADLNYGKAAEAEQSRAFKAVAEAADKWVRMGVDGFRLDAVKHIYHNAYNDENPTFLKKFYDRMNETYKAAGGEGDFYMVGEMLDEADKAAPYYRGLPALFEFTFWYKLKWALQNGIGCYFVKDILDVQPLYAQYRSDYIEATKLSNHDEDRTGSDLGQSVEKMKVAAAVLLTAQGAPYIYQGEELGYWGTKSNGDEYVRTPILWDKAGNELASGSLSGKIDMQMLTAAISVEAQADDDGSLGNTIVQYDWTDIAKLDYGNADMRAAMAAAMRFWLNRGIDGFRCDMACEVPIDFWQQTLPALRKEYPGIYLLAEGEAPALHDGAFDASYAWELHHLLNDIAQGRKSAADLRAYVARDAAAMPREAFRLMFTSNHDENSWAGTEFERMGDAARVMAFLTFTLPNGQPLVYTGQEMGFDHRFEFFEKDPVPAWEHNGFTDFYTALIRLRHENPALAAGERGGQAAYPLGERTPDGLMLFSRTAGGNEVTVAANLSAEEVAFDLPFEGSRREFFTGKEYTGGTRTVLPAWQWLVFAQDRR